MAEKPRDYSTYDLNFAANVKRRREEKGWTQGALADRLREHGLEPSRDVEESRAQAAALKRIREHERENTILRAAAAYLSQANLKLGGHHPK